MRALVLLSGGLDSAVAYAWAARERHDLVGLSFHYPGRPRGEVVATRALVARFGGRLVEVDLPFLREPTPAEDARFARAPPGYIPARNAAFYAIACHLAQVHACALIVGGHNAEDAARYPDASAAFFGGLESLLHRGLWLPAGEEPPSLVMPLLGLRREEVVALGESLGVPLEETWSCYEDGDEACGRCPACARRGGVPSALSVRAGAPRRPRRA